MNEQQRLLTVIWNDDPVLLAESGFDIQGINIYRRNLLANALRALSITFPTIFKLLDSDISENLVQQFLKLCPPDQGDWTQWGEEFPHFIATNQVAHDYPYLPDCATLDWHFHCALYGKDQSLDQTSLQVLGDIEPEKIKVIFNPNIALIKTKFPINEIFQAHHHEDKSQREGYMDKARILLATAEEHVVMLYRPDFKPQATTLKQFDAEFMFSLKSGKSLAESLDRVSQYKGFSFEKWLIDAIQKNLLYQFRNTF